MDDQNYKDLAYKAWELYVTLQEIQKMMLRMFIDDFIDIDQQKQKQAIEKNLTVDQEFKE
jgi:hypothetical protein